jgi:hypothetical protein
MLFIVVKDCMTSVLLNWAQLALASNRGISPSLYHGDLVEFILPSINIP